MVSPATRLATASDLDEVTAFDHLAAAGDPHRLTELSTAVADGRMTVAGPRGTVRGYAVTAPWFFGETFVQLLYVAPAHRRSGTGRLLLDTLVRAAAGKVFTSTNRSNAPMRRLLAEAGWTECGELVGLDDDDPELFFQAGLRPALRP